MLLPLSHNHGLRSAADLHNYVIGLRVESECTLGTKHRARHRDLQETLSDQI